MKQHVSAETYSIHRLAFRVFTAKLNEVSFAVSRAAVKAITSCIDTACDMEHDSMATRP